MNSQAKFAVQAARNLVNWGPWATHRFLNKRQVPLRLYNLALKLEVGRLRGNNMLNWFIKSTRIEEYIDIV